MLYSLQQPRNEALLFSAPLDREQTGTQRAYALAQCPSWQCVAELGLAQRLSGARLCALSPVHPRVRWVFHAGHASESPAQPAKTCLLNQTLRPLCWVQTPGLGAQI